MLTEARNHATACLSVFSSGNHSVRLAVETPWFSDIPGVSTFQALAGGLRLVMRKIAFKKVRKIIIKMTNSVAMPSSLPLGFKL